LAVDLPELVKINVVPKVNIKVGQFGGNALIIEVFLEVNLLVGSPGMFQNFWPLYFYQNF
jgi:hypothetical protein